MSMMTKEIVHLQHLLYDLGVHIQSHTPLFCVNISAIVIANNPVFQELKKHIDIDAQLIKLRIYSPKLTILHSFDF